MTEFLHVANGTSTTMTIEAAGLPGAASIWADPLHDGPVPGNLTDDGLVQVRARHLSDPHDISSLQETIEGLRSWRRVIAAELVKIWESESKMRFVFCDTTPLKTSTTG